MSIGISSAEADRLSDYSQLLPIEEKTEMNPFEADAAEFAEHQNRVIDKLQVALAETRRLNTELLEALETVTGIAGRGDAFLEFPPTIEQWKVIVKKARTAIAKATKP